MKSVVKMSGNRLQITRLFGAPRAMVFAYWTQTDKLQQWSGCKDATKVEIQADVRPGGSFTQKMQITGAGEYTFTGRYEEIVVPERIVYTASMGPALIRVTIEFFDEGECTKVGRHTRRLPGSEARTDCVAGDERIVRKAGRTAGDAFQTLSFRGMGLKDNRIKKLTR